MRNNKGFTGIEILVVVACVLLVPVVLKSNPFDRSADPSNRRTASAISGKDIVEITNTVASSDKPVTVRVDRSVDASSEVTDPKLTLSQKFGRFVSGMSTWMLILAGVVLFFFGTGPFIAMWQKYRTMKETMKRTVVAVKELDDETASKVKDKLSKKMDTPHKRVVDRLKTELN